MQRLITDNAGRKWAVRVEWLGRRVGRDTVLRRFVQRRATRRSRKAADAATLRAGRPPAKRSRWWDNADLDPGCLDVGDFPAALLILVLIVLAIWLGPGLLALVFGLGEFLLALLGAVGVILWRTLARRPWSVTATDGTSTYRWSVIGYRRARALVRSASASISSGLGVGAVDTTLIDGTTG